MKNDRGQTIHTRHDLQLTAIDFKANIKAKEWISAPERRPEIGINWPYITEKYNRTVPKRFEVAIWHREIKLCGLALGKPTRSGNKLRLDYIEKSPLDNPLSGLITDIALLGAEQYAYSIGASELRITNPINEKVKDYYLKKGGFKYDIKGNFCFREL